MLDILKNTYKNSFHKIAAVKAIPHLQEWIDAHCNPILLSISNIENLEHTKIYTILNPTADLICPYGKIKYFHLSKKTLSCSKDCQCWKDSCLKKMHTTCKVKYGSEFPTQNKNIKDKVKNTFQERHGVDFPLQKKEFLNKLKNTNLEKYGATCSLMNNDIKEKVLETNINRYGVEQIFSSQQIKEKIKKTNLERYGYETPAKNSIIKERTCKTNLKRYGVEYVSKAHISENSQNILNDKEKFKIMFLKNGVSDMAKLLGVGESLIYTTQQKFNLGLTNFNGSSYENEIKFWLQQNNISFTKDRTLCFPKEIDIFMPEHKLAIEFNGLFWHCEEGGKYKNYHFEKYKQCQNKNIQLIHIFEDEWIYKKEICKSIIAGHLNMQRTKIQARKCMIKEVSNKELRTFLNENHLQGYAPASVNFALIHDNNIVAALTFCKSRYNKNIEWELLRLATKINTIIIGGIQKLWWYFLKKYNPNSIVSYCDLRWFDGNIYKTLGFNKKEDAKPTYWYTDYTYRFHRSKFTKKKCILAAQKNTQKDISNLTEKIIARDILHLHRIWDCGQQTWIWYSL
jgi:hypothetical protein